MFRIGKTCGSLKFKTAWWNKSARGRSAEAALFLSLLQGVFGCQSLSSGSGSRAGGGDPASLLRAWGLLQSGGGRLVSSEQLQGWGFQPGGSRWFLGTPFVLLAQMVSGTGVTRLSDGEFRTPEGVQFLVDFSAQQGSESAWELDHLVLQSLPVFYELPQCQGRFYASQPQVIFQNRSRVMISGTEGIAIPTQSRREANGQCLSSDQEGTGVPLSTDAQVYYPTEICRSCGLESVTSLSLYWI
jgi:hypothetical protein